MPESNGNTHRDYSIFDNLSTEKLEDILRADTQLPNGENTDVDAVLYIMEVIAKREREDTSGRFTDVHNAWASFNENYLPYVKDDISLYDYDGTEERTGIEKAPSISVVPRRRKRRLIRFAAIVIVLFAGTVTASALGFDLWEAIAKWTSETFGFFSPVSESEESQDLNGQIEYRSLQEALDSYGITAKLAPTWLPDKYVFMSININAAPNQTDIIAAYKGNDSILTVTVTILKSSQPYIYEKDENNVTVYSVNEIDHYIMSNVDRTNIVWQTVSCECSISGKFSIDEAKRIINSIYERNTT